MGEEYYSRVAQLLGQFLLLLKFGWRFIKLALGSLDIALQASGAYLIFPVWPFGCLPMIDHFILIILCFG